MPNWIEGTLKLRGLQEKIERFFREGLEPSGWAFFSDKEPKTIDDFVKYNADLNEFIFTNEPHIKGTRRAFIQDCNTYTDEGYIVCVPIKQAWGFDAEEFSKISKQFDIDIRLYGFEMGMEFCQEIEIIKGEITIDNEISYDDWMWECPMPLMGG